MNDTDRSTVQTSKHIYGLKRKEVNVGHKKWDGQKQKFSHSAISIVIRLQILYLIINLQIFPFS